MNVRAPLAKLLRMPAKRKSVSYDRARRWVRNFSFGAPRAGSRPKRITSHKEWLAFLKRFPDVPGKLGIPNRPDRRYAKDGTWRSWQHFLSQHEKRQPKLKDFAPFPEWLDWIRKQPIRSKASYEQWCRDNRTEREARHFPSNPAFAYKGWTGWRDVFQKSPDAAGHVKGDYAPFSVVRKIIRTIAKENGLGSQRDFQRWSKANRNRITTHRIPLSPDRCYPDHWHGWADFLGTDTRPTPNRKR